jgi:hypothetical protein
MLNHIRTVPLLLTSYVIESETQYLFHHNQRRGFEKDIQRRIVSLSFWISVLIVCSFPILRSHWLHTGRDCLVAGNHGKPIGGILALYREY